MKEVLKVRTLSLSIAQRLTRYVWEIQFVQKKLWLSYLQSEHDFFFDERKQIIPISCGRIISWNNDGY